jgi:beta-glucosidase
MKFRIIFALIVALLAVSCKNPGEGSNRKVVPLVALENTEIKAKAEGEIFRDLNHNGAMDIYEDMNQGIEARIEDILGQMTLDEKAGMLFMNGAAVNDDATLEKREGVNGPAAFLPAAIDHMSVRKMTHFNVWNIPPDPGMLAKWHNNLLR